MFVFWNIYIPVYRLNRLPKMMPGPLILYIQRFPCISGPLHGQHPAEILADSFESITAPCGPASHTAYDMAFDILPIWPH